MVSNLLASEMFPRFDRAIFFENEGCRNFENLFIGLSHNPENSGQIHDLLFEANEIIFVVYDFYNWTKMLSFRGVHDVYNWFKPENIMYSNLWNIVPETANELAMDFGFKNGTFVFQIEKLSENAESENDDFNGFLKLECYSNQNCDDLTLNRNQLINDCAFWYSNEQSAIRTSEFNGFWASYVGIYTSKIISGNWLLDFKYSFWSGDFWSYYKNDLETEHFANDAYRAPNFEDRISNAAKIYLVVFDFYGEVRVEITFDVRKIVKDLSSWFKLETSNLNPALLQDSEFFISHENGFFLAILRRDQDHCQQTEFLFGIICKQLVSTNCNIYFPMFNYSSEQQECFIIMNIDLQFRSISSQHENLQIMRSLEIYTTTMEKILSFDVSSGIDFFPFFETNVKLPVSGFINMSRSLLYRSHNFEHRLTECEIIRIDTINEDGILVQQLLFGNGLSITDWFSVDNLVSSSTWDLSGITQGNFYIKNDALKRYFIIWQTAGNGCSNDEFFFVIDCKDGPVCNYRNLEDPQTCDIFYSPSTHETKDTDVQIASKIEIFADIFDIQWKPVFSMHAFCGINMYSYYVNGTIEPAFNESKIYDKFYRHPNILEEIKNAGFIRVSVYDFAAVEIVQQIIFAPFSYDDYMDWFDWDRVVKTSFWEFENRANVDSNYFALRMNTAYSFRQKGRSFTIKEGTFDGAEYFWLLVKESFMDQYYTDGDWKAWGMHSDIAHNGLSESDVKYQSPAIYYSAEKQSMPGVNLRLSGKLTIETL